MIHAVYVRIGTRYFFFHYTFSQFYLGTALPSLILCLHKTLSSASPLLHPFSLKSSSTLSLHLIFGLPLFLLPSMTNFSTCLPMQLSSLLSSCPNHLLCNSHLFSLHVQTTADVSPVPFSKVQLPLFFP
uniref:Uncharacterized protein n=1 Tax=Cacopsylla melanoneura TaxID=428564 RepID=A0A8D9BNT1_9HEMI